MEITRATTIAFDVTVAAGLVVGGCNIGYLSSWGGNLSESRPTDLGKDLAA